jgi:signal peptidase II
MLALVGLDQLTKYLIQAHFYLGETVPVTSFFSLSFAANTGVAFSMFQGANTFFAVFSVLVLAGFAWWYLKNRAALDGILRAALLFIASGAVGNLLDRVTHGHVIDFLDFSFGSYHWPSFNIADSCITIGGALLFYRLLRPARPPQEKSSSPEVKG